MIISAVVFVLCLIRNVSLIDSLMFAVALAVAAIPEALGLNSNNSAGYRNR